MYADVVLGVPHERFETRLEAPEGAARASTSTRSSPPPTCASWSREYHRARRASRPAAVPAGSGRAALGRRRRRLPLVEQRPRRPLPPDPRHPRSAGAPRSTCRRWCSGTWATTARPASPSRATRRPASASFYGEYLKNAQGEDVVAGIRTPQPINRASREPGQEQPADARGGDAAGVQGAGARSTSGSRSTTATCRTSSSRSSSGKLWMLQTRNGKRTGARRGEDRGRHGEGGADHARGGGAARRPRFARPAAPPDARPERRAQVLSRRACRLRRARRSARVVFSADEAEAQGEGRREGRARAHRDLARGHPRHARGAGHPDRARRHDLRRRRDANAHRTRNDDRRECVQTSRRRRNAAHPLRRPRLDAQRLARCDRSRQAQCRGDQSVGVADGSRERQHAADHRGPQDGGPRASARSPRSRCAMCSPTGTSCSWSTDVPAFGETATSASLGYVAGAILSDGYIRVTPTKGSVTFIQKPTDEKAEFIAAVERAFQGAFGVPFSYVRQRETIALLAAARSEAPSKTASASAASRLRGSQGSERTSHPGCSRSIATALLHFLAGYVDGDGTYAEESSRSDSRSASGSQVEDPRGRRPRLPASRDRSPDHEQPGRLDAADRGARRRDRRVHASCPAGSRRAAMRRAVSAGPLWDVAAHVNFMGRIGEG